MCFIDLRDTEDISENRANMIPLLYFLLSYNAMNSTHLYPRNRNKCHSLQRSRR